MKFLIIALLALCLTACNDDQSDDTSPSAPQVDGIRYGEGFACKINKEPNDVLYCWLTDEGTITTNGSPYAVSLTYTVPTIIYAAADANDAITLLMYDKGYCYSHVNDPTIRCFGQTP